MPVRYDPFLARALAAEVEEARADEELRELVLDRGARLALLRFREAPTLLLALHPRAGHMLEAEVSSEGESLALRGLSVGRADVPLDERLLALGLRRRDGAPGGRLVLELLTNQWNLLLLEPRGERSERANGGGEDGEGERGDRDPARGPGEGGGAEGERVGAGARIRAVLWAREPGERVLRPGAAYRPPRGGRRWRDEPPELGAWLALLGPVEPERRRGTALREAAWLSGINVEHVLGEALRREGEGPLEEAWRRYRTLRESEPEAWLLPGRPWGGQPYVRPLDDDAVRFPSLLEAMREAASRSPFLAEALPELRTGEEAVPPAPPTEAVREREEVREALEERRETLERAIASLRRELGEGPDPGALRETGTLILSRLEDVPRGREEAVLEGFDGERRRVEIDPRLSPAENAERYFEEAARRDRALERVPREMERARRRLEKVEEALAELPDREVDEELWELAGGRPREERAAGEREERRLPYRQLVSSGGLEIRVGRGARANEELTFHHSHTEDIWLHARQVPGAHVILRWGRKGENPPRRDILEAAVAAAVNSDARHSGTVAVDWTRRKYVRSPRKSAPGVVVPRNVQTVFVEPDEALVKRLRRG